MDSRWSPAVVPDPPDPRVGKTSVPLDESSIFRRLRIGIDLTVYGSPVDHMGPPHRREYWVDERLYAFFKSDTFEGCCALPVAGLEEHLLRLFLAYLETGVVSRSFERVLAAYAEEQIQDG